MPPSRWEEDSEEDENLADGAKGVAGSAGVNADVLKRAENAIFRRAISAIKPKVIEIKLRPERRVLLEPTVSTTTIVATTVVASTTSAVIVGKTEPDEAKVSANNISSEPSKSRILDRTKFNPLLEPARGEIEEKKKSVRDRLGDKVDGDSAKSSEDKSSKDVRDVDKDKNRDSKRDRRSSPSKDKVCCTFIRLFEMFMSSVGMR